MVLKAVKDLLGKPQSFFGEKKKEKTELENFRETEEMREAEDIKKEADRLAQLKQYKTSIEEYDKALTLYPYKGDEENLFPNAADFLFKLNYNIAACYSYIGDFENSITFFDKALAIDIANDENKIKALTGKGNIYYRKKMLIEGSHKEGTHRIPMETDWEVDDKKMEEYKKEDSKKNLLKMSLECFTKATDLDKDHIDVWYNKGHMEVLMGKIKEAVQSFDNVLDLKKNYENKEGIRLFDEIRAEKGIPVNITELEARENPSQNLFKAKTGHMVKSRAEMTIANFLFDNNIIFQYNTLATWADSNDFRSSFYIPKFSVSIEYFPFDYIKEYQKKMKTRIRQYEKKKKKLIYLTSEDEKNIEDSLKIKMKPYAIL